MDNNQKPIARKNEIVSQEFENEVLIYDLHIHKAFCLNQTSALVWRLCDGNRSVSQIADEMSKNLKTLVSEDLVLFALGELSGNNLLQINTNSDSFFPTQNRREIIKKIGFTSLIALPLVSALVAPPATSAQSGGGIGQACTLGNSSTCSTGNCLNSGGSGLCCAFGSSQANSPGYTICTSDGSTSSFAVRCCSGSASVSPVQSCPSPGQTRYTCDSY